VDPAAVKKAAEEAFKALSAPKKIEYLRAKAAADVAEAEAKLAIYKAKVEERLARDIAAVQKEAGSPAEALSDLVSAMSSSSSMAASPSAAKAARRTTQQVFNNLQRELAYEEGRVARRAEGKVVSPRLKKTLKTTPERVRALQAKLAESQMRLNAAATRKAASGVKKSAAKQKANNNAARLEAYMAARAEKKRAEASGAASSRSNNV
jgi:paraquat-inducible protein B